MFEIVFLGTSASAPSVHRGLPATMILHRERRFLVDAGEGTQRQLLRSGLGFKRLDTVLLTHGHLDHILGLGGIASTFARWEASEGLTIYGGRWALDRVRELMDVVIKDSDPRFSLRYVPLAPGPVLAVGELELLAFPVKHRGSGNFGFVFQERSRRPFLADRAEALGLPAGPERRRLVEGQSISLPDGRQVHPDEVLGPVIPGTKLVYIGDVAEVGSLLPIVRQADLLICESTYLWADRDTARRYGHLTAREAAELARDAGVGALVLTHLSRRYPAREIRAEARSVFPGAIVANDMDHFQLRPGSLRRLHEAPEPPDEPEADFG